MATSATMLFRFCIAGRRAAGARFSPAASVARSPRSARSGVAQSMACSTFPAHPGVGGGGAFFIALRVSLASFWACSCPTSFVLRFTSSGCFTAWETAARSECVSDLIAWFICARACASFFGSANPCRFNSLKIARERAPG